MYLASPTKYQIIRFLQAHRQDLLLFKELGRQGLEILISAFKSDFTIWHQLSLSPIKIVCPTLCRPSADGMSFLSAGGLLCQCCRCSVHSGATSMKVWCPCACTTGLPDHLWKKGVGLVGGQGGVSRGGKGEELGTLRGIVRQSRGWLLTAVALAISYISAQPWHTFLGPLGLALAK